MSVPKSQRVPGGAQTCRGSAAGHCRSISACYFLDGFFRRPQNPAGSHNFIRPHRNTRRGAGEKVDRRKRHQRICSFRDAKTGGCPRAGRRDRSPAQENARQEEDGCGINPFLNKGFLSAPAKTAQPLKAAPPCGLGEFLVNRFNQCFGRVRFGNKLADAGVPRFGRC